MHQEPVLPDAARQARYDALYDRYRDVLASRLARVQAPPGAG